MGVRRSALRAASRVLPERMQDSLLPGFCGDLKRELGETATDQFLQALLLGMDAAFALSGEYRKNIEGFRAVFVFRTRNDDVGATAVFQDGDMRVEFEPRDSFDTRLTFKDAEGLRASLLAGDEDLLNTMLTNPVEAEGNLSNLYRFGFLAKELTLRLGVG
ncbi:MAG: hypothetical protein HY822_16815 [Acidobacteria bacterium]|nr:hypothetical protein [Acidobacteriota bacterium]